MLKHNTDVIVKALTRVNEPTNTSTASDTNGNNWWLWGILGLLLVGGFVLMLRMQT